MKLSIIAADCSSEEQVNGAVERTVKELGRIDVVFNGAGIAGNPGKIVEQEVSNLDRVLGVNLRGVWLVEKAVIAQMLKQEERAVSWVVLRLAKIITNKKIAPVCQSKPEAVSSTPAP